MVTASKVEGGGGGGGGTQVLSARVLSTIRTIKEIVKNHSDADIYAALKESNMDPNETAQKLLTQDPFHEVKRRRDRKKESTAQTSSTDQRKHFENVGQGRKFSAPVDHGIRKGYTRNALPSNSGQARKSLPARSKEFRVVRDNRVNHSANGEMRAASQEEHPQPSTDPISSTSDRGLKGSSSILKPLGGQSHSPAFKVAGSLDRRALPANSSGTLGKETLEQERVTDSSAVSRVQAAKPTKSQSHSTSLASTNSVVGLYSSSTDPVHVPSPDSRSSSVVGAIKREVGVVGVRRQSSEDSVKHLSEPGVSFSNSPLRRNYTPSESFQPLTAVSKTDQLGQTAVSQSASASTSSIRSSISNQFSGKPHQAVGHQKVSQPIKEWKPKSSQRPSNSNPGIIGTPPKSAAPTDKNFKRVDSQVANMPEKFARLNIHEAQNVIIAQHIRVLDADRCQLTFGSFGVDFDTSRNSAPGGAREELNGESAASLSESAPASSSGTSEFKQVDMVEERVRKSRSNSPTSPGTSDNQLTDKEEADAQDLDRFNAIGLVTDHSRVNAPSESQQQQDPPELPSFSAYDPRAGYDIAYFRTTMEEAVRGQGLPSPQEALSSHAANSMPVSTVAMGGQQQHQQPPPVAQMYPQVHVSHFPNLMSYRQFLPPVYVPPMAMPGYSSNPAYPHPSSGNSYMLMPGGASHLNTGGLKYGVQQFKPVPAGSPTGFGNFASPAGYAVNTPGVVGSATGLDDSSRMKYKDNNLYVPTPQAETSEMWMQNPREIPGMQSPYYNMTGQTPHAAYLPSHTGHASFNAAAAQSSHMQFSGLYHPSPQAAAIANPHHLSPSIGASLGVGVAAPAPVAQVGAYQQPQLGHLNWTTNF
ncbi:GBF-interacting protein 1-like isoform X2 [Syzygium oleosum]|uniref:GBF-interacting protein 1-like isoform X2 n=1 Tax=Syzygium oleosum TaxID=219896 RepID=UPI0011D1D2CC|nr:GBF-interacting protein 1-like isoform X2 [Syzygium oleosum]